MRTMEKKKTQMKAIFEQIVEMAEEENILIEARIRGGQETKVMDENEFEIEMDSFTHTGRNELYIQYSREGEYVLITGLIEVPPEIGERIQKGVDQEISFAEEVARISGQRNLRWLSLLEDAPGLILGMRRIYDEDFQRTLFYQECMRVTGWIQEVREWIETRHGSLEPRLEVL